MLKLINRIVAFSVMFCLVFEQSGFAQVAPDMNIPAYLSGLTAADKFRPMHMRWLSYDSLSNSFDLAVERGDDARIKEQDIKKSTTKIMEYFQVGLRLPDSMFWVNLRPDAPDQIIDPYLNRTDIGRIMLEADLQLKKDLARFTSLDTRAGREYWNKLYARAEQVFGAEDISIPTVTRPWIVPNEIIIKEYKDGAYVYKATMKVMLEQDYLKDAQGYNFDDPRMKELNDYSSELVRQLIIPQLTREVNSSKRYSGLRQVFYSLVLSQWFKQRYAVRERAEAQGGQTSVLLQSIDSRDLSGLTSRVAWSKDAYFNQYVQSFQKGEYNKQETISGPNGMTIRQYFSGGILFRLQQGIQAIGQNTQPLMTIIPAAEASPERSLPVSVLGNPQKYSLGFNGAQLNIRVLDGPRLHENKFMRDQKDGGIIGSEFIGGQPRYRRVIFSARDHVYGYFKVLEVLRDMRYGDHDREIIEAVEGILRKPYSLAQKLRNARLVITNLAWFELTVKLHAANIVKRYYAKNDPGRVTEFLEENFKRLSELMNQASVRAWWEKIYDYQFFRREMVASAKLMAELYGRDYLLLRSGDFNDEAIYFIMTALWEVSALDRTQSEDAGRDGGSVGLSAPKLAALSVGSAVAAFGFSYWQSHSIPLALGFAAFIGILQAALYSEPVMKRIMASDDRSFIIGGMKRKDGGIDSIKQNLPGAALVASLGLIAFALFNPIEALQQAYTAMGSFVDIMTHPDPQAVWLTGLVAAGGLAFLTIRAPHNENTAAFERIEPNSIEENLSDPKDGGTETREVKEQYHLLNVFDYREFSGIPVEIRHARDGEIAVVFTNEFRKNDTLREKILSFLPFSFDKTVFQATEWLMKDYPQKARAALTTVTGKQVRGIGYFEGKFGPFTHLPARPRDDRGRLADYAATPGTIEKYQSVYQDPEGKSWKLQLVRASSDEKQAAFYRLIVTDAAGNDTIVHDSYMHGQPFESIMQLDNGDLILILSGSIRRIEAKTGDTIWSVPTPLRNDVYVKSYAIEKDTGILWVIYGLASFGVGVAAYGRVGHKQRFSYPIKENIAASLYGPDWKQLFSIGDRSSDNSGKDGGEIDQGTDHRSIQTMDFRVRVPYHYRKVLFFAKSHAYSYNQMLQVLNDMRYADLDLSGDRDVVDALEAILAKPYSISQKLRNTHLVIAIQRWYDLTVKLKAAHILKKYYAEYHPESIPEFLNNNFEKLSEIFNKASLRSWLDVFYGYSAYRREMIASAKLLIQLYGMEYLLLHTGDFNDEAVYFIQTARWEMGVQESSRSGAAGNKDGGYEPSDTVKTIADMAMIFTVMSPLVAYTGLLLSVVLFNLRDAAEFIAITGLAFLFVTFPFVSMYFSLDVYNAVISLAQRYHEWSNKTKEKPSNDVIPDSSGKDGGVRRDLTVRQRIKIFVAAEKLSFGTAVANVVNSSWQPNEIRALRRMLVAYPLRSFGDRIFKSFSGIDRGMNVFNAEQELGSMVAGKGKDGGMDEALEELIGIREGFRELRSELDKAIKREPMNASEFRAQQRELENRQRVQMQYILNKRFTDRDQLREFYSFVENKKNTIKGLYAAIPLATLITLLTFAAEGLIDPIIAFVASALVGSLVIMPFLNHYLRYDLVYDEMEKLRDNGYLRKFGGEFARDGGTKELVERDVKSRLQYELLNFGKEYNKKLAVAKASFDKAVKKKTKSSAEMRALLEAANSKLTADVASAENVLLKQMLGTLMLTLHHNNFHQELKEFKEYLNSEMVLRSRVSDFGAFVSVCAGLIGAGHWVPIFPFSIAIAPAFVMLCACAAGLVTNGLAERQIEDIGFILKKIAVLERLAWDLQNSSGQQGQKDGGLTAQSEYAMTDAQYVAQILKGVSDIMNRRGTLNALTGEKWSGAVAAVLHGLSAIGLDRLLEARNNIELAGLSNAQRFILDRAIADLTAARALRGIDAGPAAAATSRDGGFSKEEKLILGRVLDMAVLRSALIAIPVGGAISVLLPHGETPEMQIVAAISAFSAVFLGHALYYSALFAAGAYRALQAAAAFVDLVKEFGTTPGATTEADDDSDEVIVADRRDGGTRKGYSANHIKTQADAKRVTEVLSIISAYRMPGREESRLIIPSDDSRVHHFLGRVGGLIGTVEVPGMGTTIVYKDGKEFAFDNKGRLQIFMVDENKFISNVDGAPGSFLISIVRQYGIAGKEMVKVEWYDHRTDALNPEKYTLEKWDGLTNELHRLNRQYLDLTGKIPQEKNNEQLIQSVKHYMWKNHFYEEDVRDFDTYHRHHAWAHINRSRALSGFAVLCALVSLFFTGNLTLQGAAILVSFASVVASSFYTAKSMRSAVAFAIAGYVLRTGNLPSRHDKQAESDVSYEDITEMIAILNRQIEQWEVDTAHAESSDLALMLHSEIRENRYLIEQLNKELEYLRKMEPDKPGLKAWADGRIVEGKKYRIKRTGEIIELIGNSRHAFRKWYGDPENKSDIHDFLYRSRYLIRNLHRDEPGQEVLFYGSVTTQGFKEIRPVHIDELEEISGENAEGRKGVNDGGEDARLAEASSLKKFGIVWGAAMATMAAAVVPVYTVFYHPILFIFALFWGPIPGFLIGNELIKKRYYPSLYSSESNIRAWKYLGISLPIALISAISAGAIAVVLTGQVVMGVLAMTWALLPSLPAGIYAANRIIYPDLHSGRRTNIVQRLAQKPLPVREGVSVLRKMIEQKLSHKKTVLVMLDGFPHVGKSTFADQIDTQDGAVAVMHMDDYRIVSSTDVGMETILTDRIARDVTALTRDPGIKVVVFEGFEAHKSMLIFDIYVQLVADDMPRVSGLRSLGFDLLLDNSEPLRLKRSEKVRLLTDTAMQQDGGILNILRFADTREIRLIRRLSDRDPQRMAQAQQTLRSSYDEAALVDMIAGFINDNKNSSSEKLNAIEFLAEVYPSKAVDVAITQLKDRASIRDFVMGRRSDYHTNYGSYIADVLIKIGEEGVLSMINGLADENFVVRMQLAYVLGKIADTRAVEPLIRLLNDPVSAVRQNAMFALVSLDDARAIEPVKLLLTDPDPHTRQTAFEALQAMGLLTDAMKIEFYLNELLSGTAEAKFKTEYEKGYFGEPLRFKAATALAEMGLAAEPAIDRLKEILKQEPLLVSTRNRNTYNEYYVWVEANPVYVAVLHAMSKIEYALKLRTDPGQSEPLILQSDEGVYLQGLNMWAALQEAALNKASDPEVKRIMRVLTTPETAKRRENNGYVAIDPDPRLLAAEALGKQGAHAADVLEEIASVYELESPMDVYYDQDTPRRYHYYETRNKVKVALKAAIQSINDAVRYKQLKATSPNDPFVAGINRKVLQSIQILAFDYGDTDKANQARVDVESLGEMAEDVLLDHVVHANNRVRWVAVYLLLKIGTERAVGAVARALREDPDEDVRRTADLGLSYFNGKRWMNVYALNAYNEYRHEQEIPAIGAQADVAVHIDELKSDDQAIRNNAIQVLARSKDPRAVQALGDLLLETAARAQELGRSIGRMPDLDLDRQTRQSVDLVYDLINALARTRDERASEYLLKAYEFSYPLEVFFPAGKDNINGPVWAPSYWDVLIPARILAALGRTGGDRAIGFLMEHARDGYPLEGGINHGVRIPQGAIDALAILGDPRALPVIGSVANRPFLERTAVDAVAVIEASERQRRALSNAHVSGGTVTVPIFDMEVSIPQGAADYSVYDVTKLIHEAFIKKSYMTRAQRMSRYQEYIRVSKKLGSLADDAPVFYEDSIIRGLMLTDKEISVIRSYINARKQNVGILGLLGAGGVKRIEVIEKDLMERLGRPERDGGVSLESADQLVQRFQTLEWNRMIIDRFNQAERWLKLEMYAAWTGMLIFAVSTLAVLFVFPQFMGPYAMVLLVMCGWLPVQMYVASLRNKLFALPPYLSAWICSEADVKADPIRSKVELDFIIKDLPQDKKDAITYAVREYFAELQKGIESRYYQRAFSRQTQRIVHDGFTRSYYNFFGNTAQINYVNSQEEIDGMIKRFTADGFRDDLYRRVKLDNSRRTWAAPLFTAGAIASTIASAALLLNGYFLGIPAASIAFVLGMFAFFGYMNMKMTNDKSEMPILMAAVIHSLDRNIVNTEFFKAYKDALASGYWQIRHGYEGQEMMEKEYDRLFAQYGPDSEAAPAVESSPAVLKDGGDGDSFLPGEYRDQPREISSYVEAIWMMYILRAISSKGNVPGSGVRSIVYEPEDASSVENFLEFVSPQIYYEGSLRVGSNIYYKDGTPLILVDTSLEGRDAFTVNNSGTIKMYVLGELDYLITCEGRGAYTINVRRTHLHSAPHLFEIAPYEVSGKPEIGPESAGANARRLMGLSNAWLTRAKIATALMAPVNLAVWIAASVLSSPVLLIIGIITLVGGSAVILKSLGMANKYGRESFQKSMEMMDNIAGKAGARDQERDGGDGETDVAQWPDLVNLLNTMTKGIKIDYSLIGAGVGIAIASIFSVAVLSPGIAFVSMICGMASGLTMIVLGSFGFISARMTHAATVSLVKGLKNETDPARIRAIVVVSAEDFGSEVASTLLEMAQNPDASKRSLGVIRSMGQVPFSEVLWQLVAFATDDRLPQDVRINALFSLEDADDMRVLDALIGRQEHLYTVATSENEKERKILSMTINSLYRQNLDGGMPVGEKYRAIDSSGQVKSEEDAKMYPQSVSGSSSGSGSKSGINTSADLFDGGNIVDLAKDLRNNVHTMKVGEYEAAKKEFAAYLRQLRDELKQKDIDLQKYVTIDEVLQGLQNDRIAGLAKEKEFSVITKLTGEMLDIVDEKDNVVGKTEAGVCHLFGLRHRTANAFVFGPHGELVLQRRVHNKQEAKTLSIFGGHVSSTEEYEPSLRRELLEELHLQTFEQSLQGELRPIGEAGQFKNDVTPKSAASDPFLNKNEFRALYVYFLTQEEFDFIRARRNYINEKRTSMSKAQFEEWIEAEQKAKSGFGEVWNYVITTFEALQNKTADGRPGIRVEEDFTDRLESYRVSFSSDLLEPIVTGAVSTRYGAVVPMEAVKSAVTEYLEGPQPVLKPTITDRIKGTVSSVRDRLGLSAKDEDAEAREGTVTQTKDGGVAVMPEEKDWENRLVEVTDAQQAIYVANAIRGVAGCAKRTDKLDVSEQVMKLLQSVGSDLRIAAFKSEKTIATYAHKGGRKLLVSTWNKKDLDGNLISEFRISYDGTWKAYLLRDSTNVILKSPLGIYLIQITPSRKYKVRVWYLAPAEEEDEAAEVAKQESVNPGVPVQEIRQADGGLEKPAETVGGVDFRAIPAVVVPATVPGAIVAPVVAVNVQELERQWAVLQKKVADGQMPYDELCSYITACCANKEACESLKKASLWVSEVLKMEEDACVATSARMKDVLALL